MGRIKKLYTIFLALILLYVISTTSFQSTLTFSLKDSNDTTPEIMANLDIYENDNDFTSAKNITLNSLQERSISTIDDVDFVSFTLDSFYSIEIETTGSLGDTRLWVYDEYHNQIGFDDDGGVNLFSKLSYGIFKYGQYFIKIDEFGNDNEITNYNLTISAELTVDPFENDDVPANTLPIALNYDYERSLYPIGDIEYFRFSIVVSFNVTLEITGTDGDTEMRVCTDPDFPIATEVAYDNDGGVGGFSKIVLTNLAPATYYILIWEYGNNNAILDYTLHTSGTTDYAEDLDGPEIIVDDPYPSTTSSSEIILTATVTDFSGIDYVYLHHKLNSESWEITEMIRDYVVYFGISISPLDVGDTFSYYFTAYDKSIYHHMTTEDNSSNYYNFVVTSNDPLDPLEKDESLNYAKYISLNSTSDRRIHPIGDIDYCLFELDDKYNIEIETAGLSGDSVIDLYHENLTLISVNDNSGVDLFSKIIETLDAGNYTIKIVENGSDEVIISYSITLTAYEIHEIHEYTIRLSLSLTLIVIISIILLTKNYWKRKMKK